MGILSRFGDIISANINALLDKAEDPEKMIDQYLRNAMDDLAEVKQETAAIIAEEKRCKRLLDDAQADYDKYDGLARNALTAGNEGDAKVFLAKKLELQSSLENLRGTYEAAKANADKMRQMHNKLKNDIQLLQNRRASIKATMGVAKTQEIINKATDSMNSAGGSIAAFGRMEEKAQAMLDRANAAAELDAPTPDAASELAEKYSGGGDAAVDAELARMKAEMGL